MATRQRQSIPRRAEEGSAEIWNETTKTAAAAEVGEKRKTNTERGEAIEKGKIAEGRKQMGTKHAAYLSQIMPA